jgi:hypothetical protein
MSKSLLPYSRPTLAESSGRPRAVTEIPVGSYVVERVRVGVTGNHAQAVIVARIQGDLQTVIVRPVDISHLKNVAQEGKLGGVWPL